MIVTVKIKPWLAEFLVCRFGDPVQASAQNLVGALIAPLVDYTPAGYVPPQIDRSESLDIDIPRDLATKARRSDLGNIYLSRHNQIRFESGVSVIFKDEMFFYLNDKIRYYGNVKSGNIKDCIYQFCIDNRITFNAIQYENLKKMYYRYRKKREIHEKSGRKASPHSPLIFQQ